VRKLCQIQLWDQQVSEKCTQDLVSAFTDREQAAGIHGLGRQQCLRQELLKFIIFTHSFSAIFFLGDCNIRSLPNNTTNPFFLVPMIS
jgi:hypothetical protein